MLQMSQHYEPELINQDILTGNIGDSANLNRSMLMHTALNIMGCVRHSW